MLKSALLLILCLLPVACAAPNAPPRDISRQVKELLDSHPHLPGLVGAVVEGDQVIALGAAGVRKTDSPQPLTSNDIIHLGSCTKAMTAVLIGQLVDEGKLSFDSTLADIFTDLKTEMNPTTAKTTVLQLLQHRSGLLANVPWFMFEASKRNPRQQRRMLVKQILSQPPIDTPGRFAYSNVGYVILGAILEEKTDMPWEDLIRQRLFFPLHMNSAGFGPPSENGKIDQPWGHSLIQDRLQSTQSDYPPIIDPAGRVHCTISDWAKFVSIFLDAGAGRPRLLKQKTYDMLIQPGDDEDHYACGWFSVARGWGGGGANVLTHAGSNTTWYCVVWAAPKRNFAVLLATNVGGEIIDQECDALAAKLIEIHNEMHK